MCVGNDVRTDNRVRRSAAALISAGARVTIVGYSPSGDPEEFDLGDARVVLVPVPWTLRDARRDRRRRRRTRGFPLLGYPSREAEQVARARVEARIRELATGRDHVTAVHRRGITVRALLVKGRAAVTWRYRNRQRATWRRWDEAVGRVTVRAHWRAVLPEVHDYELAFGPVIDDLNPDVVHAHDVHMVGIATGVVQRARRRGRHLRWIYDAHEWVPGLSEYDERTARVVAAWSELEAEYIRGADRVVTVSPQLAELLRERYLLPMLPDVVLNIPEQRRDTDVMGLRDRLGIAADVPLLVYSGGVQQARGVQTAVAALPLLPDAHLAIVAVPSRHIGAVHQLLDDARAQGVSDRVHAVDPVPPDQVSQFLASADVGLIPLLHFGSHEVALTNKLFEYLHAPLPVVVSDCAAQADFVRRHGIGAVHRADEPEDLARAVRSVLDHLGEYLAAATDPQLQRDYTWATQAERLINVYDELLGSGVLARGRDSADEGGDRA